MGRTLSLNMKRAIFSQETGEVVVCLLKLDHADLAAPLRLSSDPTIELSSGGRGTVHLGADYHFLPFDITLPDELEDRPPTARLSVDNVDRQIVQAVRSVSSGPIDVELRIVLASDPDTIEVGPMSFKARNVEYDESRVSATLAFEDVLSEPFPAQLITPNNFPGLF